MKAFKHLVAAAVACAMPVCAGAQLVVDMSGQDNELSLPAEMNFTRSFNALGNTVYTPQAVMPKDGETAVVTFKYAFKSATHAPMSITVYNPAVGVQNIDNSGTNKDYIFRIPVGTYDMHAMFKGKPTGTYAVFKEQVEITNDTTLVFDVDDAIFPFQFNVYDEHGNKLYLDQYSGSTVAVTGNCNSYRSYTFFALEGMGVVHTIVGGAYRVQGYDVDYYVNEVSNRYTMCHTSNMRSLANNCVYVYKFETPMDEPGTYNSNPKNLYHYTQRFAPTPMGEGEPNSHIYAKRVWCSYNGKVLLAGKDENKTIQLANYENHIYLDVPETQDGFNVGVSAMMGDIIQSSGTVKYITGLPMCGNAATGIRSVDYGYETAFDGFIVPVGGGTALVHPGNMALSWKQDVYDESYLFGNSCPLLSVKCKDYGDTSSKLLTYLGRYGEVYETDGVTYSSKKGMDGDFTTYTFTMTNAAVDSIPAQNTTVLRYNTSAEDHSSPTVQMLRFISLPQPCFGMAHAPALRDGIHITDRGNSHSLVLEFVAGDMAYHHDTSVAANRYYDCKPLASTEAYISKHGEDQWVPLTVNEIPEYFHMPGFGYFFQAHLDKAHETGWYDLKLVLTDLTGNTHTQTIAPAVNITSTKVPGVQGDVNGDGEIDIADVNAVIDMVLGLKDVNDLADMNGDGNVDVADMNLIIDIILGL